MEYSLRDVTPGDQPFLFRLYASTREQEIAAWGWEATQSEAFLRMQFQAQQASYNHMYPAAEHQIVMLDGEPAGRILVAEDDAEIRLVDIALLNEFRNRRLGESLMRRLMEQSLQKSKPLRLQVLQRNPARHLYDRLRFRVTAQDQMYVSMEWVPVLAKAPSGEQ